MLPVTKCRIEGCDRPTMVKKHGLCRPHYLRYWAGEPVGGPIPARRKLPPFRDQRQRVRRKV